MLPLVVAELQSGRETLKSLEEKYHLDITPGRKDWSKSLVSIRYNMIESDLRIPLVQECRGLVLDIEDNFKVVCRGFDKFFNYGEPEAAEIDWSTAKVQEKVDGSCCMLFHYLGLWCVATLGSPDASGRAGTSPLTFTELFFEEFFKKFHPDFLNYVVPKEATHIFELTSPSTTVIVPHSKTNLTYLASRLQTGEYLDNSTLFGVENSVRQFPLTSFAEIIKSFDNFSGIEQEGYVVVDSLGRRVKVKHPQYTALHHISNGSSGWRRLQVVLTGEMPEILATSPEFAGALNPVKEAFERFVKDSETLWESVKSIEDRKSFALKVKDHPASAYFFLRKSGKANGVKTFYKGATDSTIKNLYAVLGFKD